MQAIELPEGQALVASLGPAAALVRAAEVGAAWNAASDLPGFTVGGVAGHLVRAAGRLEPTLDSPDGDGSADVAVLTDWYLQNRTSDPDDLAADLPTFIRDDGEQLGRQGPEFLATELEALAARLRARLATEPADRFVRVLLTEKPVPLVDYLATRLLEVVVHADDIAAAASVPTPSFGDDVVDVAMRFLMRLARARSGDVAVLRALTREGRVTDPYDVLRVL